MIRLVVLVNLAVALLLSTATGLQLVSDRTRVVGGASEHAENLADLLAEHTVQILATLDLGLTAVAAEVRAMGPTPDLGSLHATLARNQEISTSTYAFFVANAEGRLSATSRTAEPAPVDLSDTGEFQWLRNNPSSGLWMGAPRRGRVGFAEERWIINVGRRIEAADGTFLGIAAAALSVDHMLNFYGRLRIGRAGVLELVRTDGIGLLRTPFRDDLAAKDYSATSMFQEFTTGPDNGRVTLPHAGDGLIRISAYRYLRSAPVLVYAGLAQDEVLAPWHARLRFHLAVTVLAMALILGASLAVTRLVVRRRSWEESRSKRLKRIADESAALTRCPDIRTLLGRVTDAARSLIGAHQAIASVTRDGDMATATTAFSLSEKYRQWWDYDEVSDGSGIYRLVCESNQPMMMTQAALVNHPLWRGFGDARDRHPPMNGWLAVPIVSHDGRNLGLIQLSDRFTGEFSDDDLHEMLQFASLTGVAVDNLWAKQDLEAAVADATAARAEIETVLASISDGVFAVDTEWRFVYLNPEAERQLHRSQSELLGRNLWEAFPEAKDSLADEQYHRARREGVPVSFEMFYPPLNAWLAVRAYPHSGGLTVYFQDITRQVQAEERLQQAQKMEAIGQLTGGVAHDFNNLLTVILGGADALLEDLEGDPAACAGHALLIRQGALRAAELTHQLLAFARKQPLDPRPTDISALLREMKSMLARSLGERIEIELAFDPEAVAALVDPNQLQHVILNLAVNARDAMADGGKLTLATGTIDIEAGDAGGFEVGAGRYALIRVQDTGEGMTPGILQRAFEPFFTTKPPGSGSGLGLAMVHGFVRQSGGDARLESAPGAGTTVTLLLPLADARAELPPSPDGHETPASGGERILLVEDEALVRGSLLNTLQGLGYAVTACADGREAIVQLQAGAGFDLLLTDVVLPGANSGREVAEYASSTFPSIKVLFISGYAEDVIVHEGRLDPGVQLLSKPFRRAELARRVREVLDRP